MIPTLEASLRNWVRNRVWVAAVLLGALPTMGCAPAVPASTEAGRAPDLSAELPASLRDWPATVVRPRYSPDGNAIAFASDREGTLDLYVVQIATSEVRRLTEGPFDDTRPAWSPEGSELVFQTNRDGSVGLWILSLDDGALRPLTTGQGTEAAPDWSPTGDLITYVSSANGSWDVWVVRPDGGGSRAVTSHEGNEYHPKFSPDGEHIVFYPTWHGWTDIATVRVSDGTVTELLSGEHEDYRPVWSPGGEWIAFASDRSEAGALWALPAAGGEPRPLLESELSLDFPDWRPDGGALIYVEESYDRRLFEFDISRGTERVLTPDILNTVDRNPDLAPNRDYLVFETSRYGNEGNVALLNMTTGEERRVTAGRVNDGSPRFSPDGTRLVYISSGGDQASSQAMIAAVDPASAGEPVAWTEQRNVAFPSFCGVDAIIYGWSEIAYSEAFELWRAEEGSPAQRVGSHVIERGGVECGPEGAWVIASLHQARSSTGALPRLVRIDLSSGASHVLTHGEVPQLHPRLSADGTEVLFVAAAEGGMAAYVVPIGGGPVREVIAAERNVGMADWGAPGTFIYAEVTRIGRARMVSTRAALR